MDDGKPPLEAPRQFQWTAELNVGIEQAFELLGSAEGMERWVPLCRGVRYAHPPGASGLAVGSVRTISFAGVPTIERILRLEPPRRLDYTVEAIGVRIDTFVKDYRGETILEPLGPDRCRLTWSVYFRAEGTMRPLVPLFRALFRSTIGTLVKNVAKLTDGTVAA
jgi:uncharacterized protein YndB with AHSA1/START domain